MTTREIKKFIYEWNSILPILEPFLSKENILSKNKDLLIFLIALKINNIVSYNKLIDFSNIKKLLMIKANELRDENDDFYQEKIVESSLINKITVYEKKLSSSFVCLLDYFCNCIGIDKREDYFIANDEISESIVLLFSCYYITGEIAPYNMRPGTSMPQISNIEAKLKLFTHNNLIKIINFIDFGKLEND